MRRAWFALLAAAIVAGGSWLLSGVTAFSAVPLGSAVSEVADVRDEVWTVIDAKCLRCHNRREKKGKLDMSSRAGLLAGGESGPALIVGDAEQSLMIELIDFDEMPPRKEKLRVTKGELDKLRAWIIAGAADRAETRDRD